MLARLSSIFGRGDEDSDLSDVDEADIPQPSNLTGDATEAADSLDEEGAAIEAEAEAAALAKEAAEEAAADANDADYTQQEKADVNGLPKFRKDPNAPKKKRREGADGGEDSRPKCAQKSQESRRADVIDATPSTESARRRRRVPMMTSTRRRRCL